jgi:hypothetical protein
VYTNAEDHLLHSIHIMRSTVAVHDIHQRASNQMSWEHKPVYTEAQVRMVHYVVDELEIVANGEKGKSPSNS